MKGNILVIDDNPTDLRIATSSLERAGYACYGFLDHVPAMDWIIENSPHTIFLDLQLQGITGFEVTTLLRAHPKTKDVPIIIISGLNQIEDVKKAIELGANDYVVKPLDPLVLQEKASKARNKSEEEFHIVELSENSQFPGAFTQPFKVIGISEFGVHLTSKVKILPGQTVDIGDLPKEIFGSQSLILRCLSSEEINKTKIYSMQFTFIGLTEGQRQSIRKASRQLWIQNKGAAA